MKTYKVIEIFKSIQGEGHFAGTPSVFVRFAGCNMKCKFCDTGYGAGPYKDITAEEILKQVRKLKPRHVVLTGGEPMLSLDDAIISAFMIWTNGMIQIETNGSVPPQFAINSNRIWLTVSPKKPHGVRVFASEIKVVASPEMVRAKQDYFNMLLSTGSHICYVQPMELNGKYNTKTALALIERLGYPWRLSCQIHKFLNIK